MSEMSSFYNLNPDRVLHVAELAGFKPTGEFMQLNSYENRVFDIKVEDGEPIIGKFYRPHRWSEEAILEEHGFLAELQAEDIPAIAPLLLNNQKTLMRDQEMWVSFFPKIRARMPQEMSFKELEQVGILLARLHNVGARKKAQHRLTMDTTYYGGWSTLDFLQEWITPSLRDRYLTAAETILNIVDDTISSDEFIRIHGDCHKGNLLHNGQEFFLLDFDDFVNGPVIQDFWMLLSGEEEQAEELKALVYGYEELREFPDHQWDWVPLLRGQRIISYSGWIAKRWQDPSFPALFPDFNSFNYWAEEVEALEKIAWTL